MTAQRPAATSPRTWWVVVPLFAVLALVGSCSDGDEPSSATSGHRLSPSSSSDANEAEFHLTLAWTSIDDATRATVCQMWHEDRQGRIDAFYASAASDEADIPQSVLERFYDGKC